MAVLRTTLQALENGKTIRLDGASAGVHYVNSIQQFWEAVRVFESQSVAYSIEIVT